MTSDPLDLDAAVCRFVLDDLSGGEVVAVAGHALEQGRWSDEFCVLVGWKEPWLREVGPYFERGVRSLGLSFPRRREAMIGIGIWRSKQILDGSVCPVEAATSLQAIALANWAHEGQILDRFYCLVLDLDCLEYLEYWGQEPGIERSIVEAARDFLAEHEHQSPSP